MADNCTVHRILFYMQGCIDEQEIAGVMLGVFSAALWTLVHISFYSHQRRNMKMNRFVTSSITTHMIADGFSCMGAILSQQKSLQVIFALFGTVVNASIGLHCWCSKSSDNTTSGDLNGNQRKGVSDKYHCFCSAIFLTLCLMFITMCVTEYLTISDDNVIYEGSKQIQPHTVIIVGYIFGSVGTLSYWLSKFYEVVESYRSNRNRGVHTCMYLTAITGDTTYLLGVYIQLSTVVYVIQTLPWTLARHFRGRCLCKYAITGDSTYLLGVYIQLSTVVYMMQTFPWSLARMGLIGIHIGIIFQRGCTAAEQTRQTKQNDKITLLRQEGKSDSDWSDDNSTVLCGACDIQTSVKQIICSQSPTIQKYLTTNINNDEAFKQKEKANDESASSESPELEWDFEWLSDTKKRQFTKMDIQKLSPYDGYYKVVEWFKKTCDNVYNSDVDDFIENNNNTKEKPEVSNNSGQNIK